MVMAHSSGQSSGQGIQDCVTMKGPNHKCNSRFPLVFSTGGTEEGFSRQPGWIHGHGYTIRKTQIQFSATIALT